MKIITSTILCFFCTLYFHFPAYSLSPQEKCPLLDHLIEVNRLWISQDIPTDHFYSDVVFLNDEKRIQMHLQLITQLLSTESMDHLQADQKSNRLRLISQLQQYAINGNYPRNTFHSSRRPYFIDTAGTACAVGHLLLENDQEELAKCINRENNFAYISELVKLYPTLTIWATDNGFTTSELAWIQPGYFPPPLPFLPLANDGGVNGKVNVMFTNEDESLLYIGGLFDEVDGVPANNIIAWDGSNWNTLGDGVDGEIYAMEYFDNKLFVGGSFSLFNNPNAKNIAYWDGSNWNGLQEGDMNGSVYALKFYWNKLYAGGDFQLISGDPMPHLAYYEYTTTQTWKNSAQPIFQDEIPNAIEVNGPVRSFAKVGPNLLVGGDFTLTAPNVTDTLVNSLDAHYLAFWNHYEYWVGALYGSHNPVHATGYFNGGLFIGGNISEDIGFSLYQAGLWFNEGQYGPHTLQFRHLESSDSTIHQFIPYQDKVLILGGFFYSSGATVRGNGAAVYDLEIISNGESIHTLRGFAQFDHTVRAAVQFQEQLIFAGDFEKVNSIDVNNFALLDFSTPVNEPLSSQTSISVSILDDYLGIKYKDLQDVALLNLYNLQGQLCLSVPLEEGSAMISVPITQLPTGAYVYQIRNTAFLQSGKLIK